MGCGSSSQRTIGFSSRARRNPLSNPYPEQNPNPLNLCRDRTELIRSACVHRYDAAAAHVAYLSSLSALGESLQQFAHGELYTSAPGSPVLTLPPSSKGFSKPCSHSDSDSDTSTVSPLSHALSIEDGDKEALKPSSSTVTPLSHALSVGEIETEQKPQSVTSIQLEKKVSRSSLPKDINMATANARPSSPRNTYQPFDYNYPYGYGYGYGYDNGHENGYANGFGYGYETTNWNLDDKPGPSNQVTPPMPVQDSSGWEFFDPFSNYDQFIENYRYLNSNSSSLLSSPDLNTVRKKEGIPDLEDEIKFEEKQKELEREREREKQREIERAREKQSEIEAEREKQREIEAEGEKQKELERQKQEKGKEQVIDDAKDNTMRPSTSVTMEKTKSINTEEGSGVKNKDVVIEDNGSDRLVAVRVRDLDLVMEEIKEQFDNVVDCAKEVTDMLEVDKVPHRTGPLGAISSRILDPTLPIFSESCLPHKHLTRRKNGPASDNSTAGTANGDNNCLTTLSLSLTLDKLYVWEKRLYKEVKDEEKLRAEYEKKHRRLKYLDDRGADYAIVKTTSDAIASLRNRISIVVKSADTISRQIHHIRDEELQPQLMHLVQSLIGMWQSIFYCHSQQLKAIRDLNTRNIKPRIGSDPKSVARFTRRLEKEISRWQQHLKDWIGTQISFIDALNGYLIRWILNEPVSEEETLDGVPPFSPGRMGAPPSFVISNDWCQGVKKVSEEKILDCIANFKNLVKQYRKFQEDENRFRTKTEYLSMIYNRKLKSLSDETGVRNGTENSEIVSINGKENPESTETLHHEHDHDRHMALLEEMKKRRDEESEKQMVALEKLNNMGSSILKTGLVPIFEELVNFLSEYLMAYEAVRIPVH